MTISLLSRKNNLNDNDSLPRGEFYRLKYRLFWGSTTECLSDICFSYPSFWCDFLPFSFSRSATFSHNRHRLTLFGWIQIGKCWNCQMESFSIRNNPIPAITKTSSRFRILVSVHLTVFWRRDFVRNMYEICTKMYEIVEKVRYQSYWQNRSLLTYSFLDFRNFELWYGRDGE